MTILVTGGAGYIGSHVVWDLVDSGEKVVVVDNLSTGFRWALPPEAELVTGDVGDGPLLAEIVRSRDIDAIIHFAGSVIVPESVAQPLRYYLNNTVKSRTLIETAVETGVKNFVFSSTATVYALNVPTPIIEEAPKAPPSPYGWSKRMTEVMLADTAVAYDFDYVALRYFNVAGADPKGRTGQSTRGATHLIKVAAEAALGKRKGVEVFGTDYPTPDGTGVRDYIHVTDLSHAHLAALTYLRKGGDSIVANCSYGHGYSVLEVLDSVSRVSGKTLNVTMADRRPGDPPTLVGDPGLIRRTFDWTPQHDDLDFIIRTALDWEEALTHRNQRE
ncbi:MAG: UDP-glucose 4-epimerase GalE [Bauldia sp.]